MAKTRKRLSISACESEVRWKFKDNKFKILHHNVQSLWNKYGELTVLFLNSVLQDTDALCFTEHWSNEDHLTLVEINNFKLVSKFCRKQSKGDGSCLLVNKEVNTREVIILNELKSEENFEISGVETVKLKWVLVCIYRSLHSDVNIFLKKLELLIDRIHKKKI
jgi:hypothetical protein